MMTELQFERAKELRIKISETEKFIYAIDKDTMGTLGHTGKCDFVIKQEVKTTRFALISSTNQRSYIFDIPESIALEIGEISKRELEKLKNELSAL